MCACPAGDQLVIGNGDHVELVAAALVQGSSLADALVTVEPEPDALHTPRIGAVISERIDGFRVFTDGHRVVRDVEPVHAPREVVVVTTYDGSVDAPIGSAPVHRVLDDRPFDTIVNAAWSALSPELRVLAIAGSGASLRESRVLA